MIKLLQLISELQISNPNVTAEEVLKFWQDEINKKTDAGSILGKEYIKMRTPYVEKYIPDNVNPKVENSGRLIYTLPQHALNNFYQQIKKLVNKNINELNVTKPSRTYDLRKENWPNLSSAIFDKIEIGDRIIDPEFIGIVYEIEFDDMLDGYIIAYKDDKGGDKFIDREWFDSVSGRTKY